MNKRVGIFLLMAAALTAAQGLSGLQATMSSVCGELQNMLPVVSMLMVVVSAVIYASGQLMGAETRARANVWATAALTGALIGGLIYAIAPFVFAHLFFGGGTDLSCLGGTIGA